MEVEQVLEKLSDEHNLPLDDVKEIFEEKLEECEDAGLKGDSAKERAVKRTWSAFRRRSQSSSIGVQGVILGAGDRYDSVSNSRQNAIEAYTSNPQRAIKDGEVAVAAPPDSASNLTGNGVEVVTEKNGWAIIAKSSNQAIQQYDFAERGSDQTDDGEAEVDPPFRVYPLDTRETFNDGSSNDRYGMPTPQHMWRRRAVGVFVTDQHDEARRGQITLRGAQSAPNPPLHQAVQFEARVNESDDGNMLYINSTSDTEFHPDPELEDKMPDPDILLTKDDYFPQGVWRHDLGSLYEFLEEQQGARTVVCKGDVIRLDMEQSGNNTYRMVIGDMSWAGGDLQEFEATVWIPAWQEQYIDFAQESEVYVLGRARLQDAYDPQAGERTSEEQEVVMNAQGIYADPATKVPREEEVEELEEDDLQFEEEPVEDDGDEVEFAADGEGDNGGSSW